MMDNRYFDDDLPTGAWGGADSGAQSNGHGAAELVRRSDFTLGAARISPSVRTLEGPSGQVKLEPRVMQVLLAFNDANGAVLARDDLLRRCWNGQVVGDDAVNRAIAGLRRAAATAKAGFTVETVPRIGYRLTVEEAGDAATSDRGRTPKSGDVRSSRRGVLLGAAGLGAAALAGGAWWRFGARGLDAETADLVRRSDRALQLDTLQGEQQAVALLEAATRRSPDEPLPWGRLALARALGLEHRAPKDPVAAVAAVEQAADRARSLEPRNADAHAALAILTPYFGDWLAAERRFDAVLAIDSGHIATRSSRDFMLNGTGYTREAALDRVALTRGHDFDAGLQYRLVMVLWMLGRIEEGDRVASRGTELWPRHMGVWQSQFWILAGTGRLDRALAHAEDVNVRPPMITPLIPSIIATLKAKLGGSQAARSDAIDSIMARVAATPAAVIQGMMLLHLLDALDQIFAVAEAYYLQRGPVLAATRWAPGQQIGNDQRRRKTNMLFVPIARPMQQDPRFGPLMEDMGLAGYWRGRGVVPDHLKG